MKASALRLEAWNLAVVVGSYRQTLSVRGGVHW